MAIFSDSRTAQPPAVYATSACLSGGEMHSVGVTHAAYQVTIRAVDGAKAGRMGSNFAMTTSSKLPQQKTSCSLIANPFKNVFYNSS